MKSGSVIEFHDEISLSRLLETKQDVSNGKQLVVQSVINYETNYHSSIDHIKFKSSDEVAFRYGANEEYEYFIGSTPSWFINGPISDVLERGDTFLFQEPDDTNNINFDKLEIAHSFSIDEINYDRIFSYDTIHCDYVVTVGLFKSEKELDNPYIFVLWYGMGESAVIELFNGYTIDNREVKIIG